MKLTKDEARILGEIMAEGRYNWLDSIETKVDANNTAHALGDLLNRLQKHGKDKRRRGRTSMNDFSDLLRRFTAAFLTRTKTTTS